MTNITFIFHQLHPLGRKRGKIGEKLKLVFSTILISIPTKPYMRITNMTLVFLCCNYVALFVVLVNFFFFFW